MQERRRTERADGTNDIGIAVRTSGGVHTAGSIVRVSHERLTVAFPATQAPEIEPWSRVSLLFRTIHGAELTAVGRLAEEVETRHDQQLFEFVFDSAGPLPSDPAPTTPLAGDNQREAYRVELDPLAVRMAMRPCGDPADSILRQLMNLRARGGELPVKGWVYDISYEGVCVLIDDCESQVFEPGDRLDMTLTLPGSSEPLRIGVQVEHRIGVRYGMSFDASTTTQFDQVQEQVLEFVIREQQEALRWRTA